MLFFTAEVTVSAKTVVVPEGCLNSGQRCAIEVVGKSFESLLINQKEVVLAPGSVIIREKNNSISFIKGRLWVSSKTSDKGIDDGSGVDLIKIKVPYGFVEGSDEFYCEKTVSGKEASSDNLKVYNVSGKVILQSLEDKKTLNIRPGQSNWLGPVSESGIGQSGIPVVINIGNFLPKWHSFYQGPKKKFEKKVRQFFVKVKEESLLLSKMYEESSKREIASAKLKAEKRRKYLEKLRRDEKEIRDLFRERNFY